MFIAKPFLFRNNTQSFKGKKNTYVYKIFFNEKFYDSKFINILTLKKIILIQI